MTKIIRFDQMQQQLYDSASSIEKYKIPQFADELHTYLDRYVRPDTILSLDVFDTVLLRDNSSELGRFFKIGAEMARLTEVATAADAFLARDAGTKATYRAREAKSGAREGSLREIHHLSSRILTGSEALAEDFIKVELDFEAATLSVNQTLIDYVEKHIRRGGQAILLSDMYMHQEHIRYLLNKLAVDASLFRLIISSADTLFSKASGLIFPYVEDLLGVSSSRFFHAGDRLSGDFQKPLKAGWQALHLPVSRTDVILRRRDHELTWNQLKNDFGIKSDVAYPD